MSEPRFGTDGIRGVANSELTPELALRLGQAAGTQLMASDRPKSVVIGQDTRQSGQMLESALASGFMSAGVDALLLGIAPTPAVAFVTRHFKRGLGAVISASHNPAPDNGIKLFGADGAKLPDSQELEISKILDERSFNCPTGGAIGRRTNVAGDIEAYWIHLSSLVPEGLGKLRIAIDSANGAAVHQISGLFEHVINADREVTVLQMGSEPDGTNINLKCGATHPEAICRFTVETKADIGVAFDGDADRVVFCDSSGKLVNGDRAMGIWAAYHHQKGELEPPTVVGTVMSNGGFERYLNDLGIMLLRTPVGDKYVSRELESSGSLIGGEQSGHIVFPKHAPSGDGLLTMIELLRVLKLSGKTLAEWSSAYEPWPQLLINLTVAKPKEWDANPKVHEVVVGATEELSGKGRVNVRPSGTQPMLRVMVEADSYELRDQAASQILKVMELELGASVYSKVDLTHDLGD